MLRHGMLRHGVLRTRRLRIGELGRDALGGASSRGGGTGRAMASAAGRVRGSRMPLEQAVLAAFANCCGHLLLRRDLGQEPAGSGGSSPVVS